MAKISDEIRKWCADLDSDDILCTTATLYTLADRIDRELVELPRDADGVPIHVGDTVWDVDNGIEFTATSITLYASGVAKVDASCEGCHAHTSPSDFTHTHPDSWERIANELEAWCDSVDVDGDACDMPRDLADRIRKLAKEQTNE